MDIVLTSFGWNPMDIVLTSFGGNPMDIVLTKIGSGSDPPNQELGSQRDLPARY